MRVIELDAFPVDEVKGDSLPYVDFDDELKTVVEDILASPPGVITFPAYARVNSEGEVVAIPYTEEQLPFERSDSGGNIGDAGYKLQQISPFHRRSFELVHPDLPQHIEDEFGNSYKAYSLKGGNYSAPGIITSLTATREHILNGQQEARGIRRVLRASAALREAGVGTEFVLGLSEPERIPMPDTDKYTDEVRMLGRRAFRLEIIDEHWRRLPDEERTFERLQKLRDAIDSNAYYISLRAADTNVRARDVMTDPAIARDFFDELSTPDREINMNNYFDEVLLPAVARNMALMHRAELVHVHPVDHNVTALGSIVDLDSVVGEPLGLGDEPVTAKQKGRDIYEFATDIAMYWRQMKPRSPEIHLLSFTRHYAREFVAAGGSEEELHDILASFIHEVQNIDVDDRNAAKIILSMSAPAVLKPIIEQEYGEHVPSEASELAIARIESLPSEIADDLYDSFKANLGLLARIMIIDLINEDSRAFRLPTVEEPLRKAFFNGDGHILAGLNFVSHKAKEVIDHEYGEGSFDAVFYHPLTRSEVMNSIWETTNNAVKSVLDRLLPELSAYFDEGRIADELLIGEPDARYFDHRGNVIYDAERVPYSVLSDVLKRGNVEIKDYPADTTDMVYKLTDDKRLVQVVTFGEHEDMVLESEGMEDGSQEVWIAKPYRGLVLLTEMGQDQELIYTIYRTHPSLLPDDANVSGIDGREIENRVSDYYPEQMELFNAMGYTKKHMIDALREASES